MRSLRIRVRPARRPGPRLALHTLEDRVTPTLGALLQTLSPPGGAILDGMAVAATSQYVVVGAPNVNTHPGSVGVYDASSGALLYTLTSPTASNGDQFGQSVAISGSYVVVGAPGDDTQGTDTGQAYVFDLSGGTPTTAVATLINPDPTPSSTTPDGFGDAVAVSGTTAWVGAVRDSATTLYGGRVLKYDALTGTNTAVIDAPSEAVNRDFGGALAVSGNLLVVAASGSGPNFEGKVYVYGVGGTPTLQTTIDEPGTQGSDEFGAAVAMEGTTLAVGAPRRDVGGITDVGAAYVFSVPAAGGSATLQTTINNPHAVATTTPYTGEWFGHGIGIANGAVVVGAPYDNSNAPGGGEAYLFDAANGSLLANVLNPYTSGNLDFGWAAAAAGDKLIVGADHADEAYTFQGQAPLGPPSVTINQGSTQADPTNSNTIKFDVVFSANVTGFTGTDVDLTGSTNGGAGLTATVTQGADAAHYTVSVTGMAGVGSTGTVVAKIPAGAAIDGNSNGNTASTSSDNSVSWDYVKPNVTINQGSSQSDPTSNTTITFDVHFDKVVTGFTAAGVDLLASTDPLHLTKVVAPVGNGQDYTVTVTVQGGSAVPNTVIAKVTANAAQDGAGNGNTASTSSDNSVTYSLGGKLQLASSSYTVAENGGSLQIKVQRVGGSNGAVSVDYATADGTGAAGTDYTTTTGTLNWASGDTADKTITVPILDGGVPENDKTFAVNLSNFQPGSAQGSPTSATVTIAGRNELAFDQASYPLIDEGGTATFTVNRVGSTSQTVTVQYATSDGTGTATGTEPDYTATNGTLTWAAGDGNAKTFTVTIPVDPQHRSDGRETFHVTLSSPTGLGAVLGARSTALETISPHDGKPAGTPFLDADGDLVTPKLAGGTGAMMYYLTDGVGPISEIDLIGTDPMKSVVSVVVTKPKGDPGDGRVTVGEIDGNGAKSINLSKSDLVGAGINVTGFVGSITVGNVLNGADILVNAVGGPPLPGQGVRIKAGVIGDNTDVRVTSTPLGSLTAIAVGKDTIEAPSVGTITVKGQKANPTKGVPAVSGDFKAVLTVAGTGLTKGPALKSLKVAGAVNGATITVGSGSGTVGDVGSVSAGSFVDSDLFAGYLGATDGSGAFYNGTIGSFSVKGATNAFSDSYVIAPIIKTVSLSTIDPNNGAKFGFLYHFSLGALSVKAPAFKFNPAVPGEQDGPGEFYVKKV